MCFAGERIDTSFFVSAEVSVQDPDGRRPEDYSYAGTRFVAELPDAAAEGRTAAERTLARVGAQKGASAVLTMLIENRAAGRLVGALLGPLSAQAIQQKRSFLEGQAGQAIGSSLLDLTDDPLVPKGFGSRLWDGEGLAARQLPIYWQSVSRPSDCRTSMTRNIPTRWSAWPSLRRWPSSDWLSSPVPCC